MRIPGAARAVERGRMSCGLHDHAFRKLLGNILYEAIKNKYPQFGVTFEDECFELHRAFIVYVSNVPDRITILVWDNFITMIHSRFRRRRLENVSWLAEPSYPDGPPPDIATGELADPAYDPEVTVNAVFDRIDENLWRLER